MIYTYNDIVMKIDYNVKLYLLTFVNRLQLKNNLHKFQYIGMSKLVYN